MSRDKSGKEKNIEDVLSSIDSLLDTATDIELPDSNENKDLPVSPETPKTNTAKLRTKPEQSSRAKAKPQPAPKQKRPVRISKKSESGDRSSGAKTGKPDKIAKPLAETDVAPAKSDNRPQHDIDQTPASTPARNESMTDNDKSDDEQISQPDASNQDHKDQSDTPDSLAFTTVDDDISHVMRELPVLDDIVTAEELALIGSGKELPKKVLTEAFKRQSLTDKLIQILENQLSDYNISKLEYKYLHELFDELLEEEKNRQ